MYTLPYRLETAELTSALADHDVDIIDTLGMGNVPGSGRPLALIPMTAGTGSEVTHIGVFSDNDGIKQVVYDKHLFAEIAELLDTTAAGSTLERAYASVDTVFTLTEDVDIPTTIGHLGDLDREELESFADIAFEYSQHNIDRNPRDLDRSDVILIYENAR